MRAERMRPKSIGIHQRIEYFLPRKKNALVHPEMHKGVAF